MLIFRPFTSSLCLKASAGIKLAVHKTDNIPSSCEANAQHHWQPNWPLKSVWLQTKARAGESTEQQMTCTLDCTLPDACCHVSVPIERIESTTLSIKTSMSGFWVPDHSPPTPAGGKCSSVSAHSQLIVSATQTHLMTCQAQCTTLPEIYVNFAINNVLDFVGTWWEPVSDNQMFAGRVFCFWYNGLNLLLDF